MKIIYNLHFVVKHNLTSTEPVYHYYYIRSFRFKKFLEKIEINDEKSQKLSL